jgi:hypothetical protein
MPPTIQSASSTAPQVLGGANDVFLPLRGFLFDAPDGLTIISSVNTFWNIFSLVSFVVAGFFIFGIIYAMQRMSQLEAHETQSIRAAEKLFQQMNKGSSENSRWHDVTTHIQSPNPSDWRLAIVEADIILEEALEEIGLAGNTIGEKLKGASSEQLRSLDDAWKAHRVRNEIAHTGADFVLTQRIAQETVNQYQRVFVELGKI